MIPIGPFFHLQPSDSSASASLLLLAMLLA